MTEEVQRSVDRITRLPKPHDFSKFNLLMENLERWRTADHEDAITLTRHQMIVILEGVKALRRM